MRTRAPDTIVYRVSKAVSFLGLPVVTALKVTNASARDVKHPTTMFSGAARAVRLSQRSLLSTSRPLHTTNVLRETPTRLTNILADEVPLATQVQRVTEQGIHLEDGRIVPSSCIIMDQKLFLWNVPQTLWEGWTEEHFHVFDVVVPKPGAQIRLQPLLFCRGD